MKKSVVAEPIRSEKRFWTVKDAARYLGMRDTTLYDWIKSAPREKTTIPDPPPPVYRFGTRRGIRFPIQEFIQWAENFRQGSK
jgi:transposase-like protein